MQSMLERQKRQTVTLNFVSGATILFFLKDFCDVLEQRKIELKYAKIRLLTV